MTTQFRLSVLAVILWAVAPDIAFGAIYPAPTPPGQFVPGPIVVKNTNAATARIALDAFGLMRTTNLLNNPLNVLSWGADPTGLLDSTVALQNAFSAAGSNLLVFPNFGATYKVSGTITLAQGQKVDFNGSTIVNSSTNFTFKFLAPTDAVDNYGPWLFRHGIIRAKNGIQFNVDGDFNTVFAPQESLLGVHFDKMQFFGTYTAGSDPNYGTGVMPSDSELQGYGIGLRLTKVVDANIDQCLFSGLGVGLWMMGCDVTKVHKATRFQANANHIRNYGIQFWGGQTLMADLDCIQNARVGGIYIGTNFNWRVERCFLEGNLGSATEIYETNTFGGSFIDNVIPNTGQTNTPILAFGPRFGLIVAHNHFTLSPPLGHFVVNPGSQWTSSNPILGVWTDNEAAMPPPIGAGIFLASLQPYKFCSTNYEILSGAVSASWPWSIDPFTGRSVITTNNPTLITQMHLASPADQAFWITFSGRRAISTGPSGFCNVTYVENGVTNLLYGSDLLFSPTVQTNTESRTIFVTLPQGSAGTGYLQYEYQNDEVALESIVATPNPRIGLPYLLASTNTPNTFFQASGATRNLRPWVTDPFTGRAALPTNNGTLFYVFPLQNPGDRNFWVTEVGRPTSVAGSTNGGFQNWTYHEGTAADVIFSQGVGFPNMPLTNADYRIFPLSIPVSTNYFGQGFLEVELANTEVQYESIRLVPIPQWMAITTTNTWNLTGTNWVQTTANGVGTSRTHTP